MKIFTKLSMLLATLASMFVLVTPAMAFAAPPATPPATTPPTTAQSNKDSACEGLALAGGDCASTTTTGGVGDIVKAAINIFSILVGIVAVIMIMVGGFKYITSNGDSGSVNSAKNTILYAIIGLVIVAAAQLIVQFVLTNAKLPANSTTTTTPAPTP